ncbi:hypothetical protein E4T39_05232 [Aureobasidium subglaciale]|nr:hypothetical protein E4T39_05232 [Aureobasidium subglaciale]
MSVNRSNSQVRNLLAMFENNNNNNNTNTTSSDSTSPDRGRSNGHLSPASNGDRPLSKVRSSFVSVEHGTPSSSSPAMDIDPQKTKEEYTQSRQQESSANLRRHSFSHDESSDAVANIRQSMSQEEERRGSNPMVAETIPEAAIEQTPTATTPAVEAKDYLAAGQVAHSTNGMSQSKLREQVSADDAGASANADQATDSNASQSMPLPADDMPADNPAKPISGVQEEPGPMQPSDLKDRSLVSPTPETNGHDTSTPSAELPSCARRGTVTAADPGPASTPHRPANIVATAAEPSTGAPPKTPTSVKKGAAPTPMKKSPAAKPSSTLSPKAPVRKTSNLSLTQGKPKSDAASTKTKSPQSKPTRPRSPTRPVNISSHLTAPTAASAARQDPPPARASVSSSKPAVASRPQARAPAATAKPTVRPSLASTSSAPKKAESKPAPAAKGSGDGFLARMMRPTASSASKVHDKTDVKSPPKRTPSVLKSKGLVKPKITKSEKTKPSPSAETSAEAAGASTPKTTSGDREHDNSALEATPAFDAATIR